MSDFTSGAPHGLAEAAAMAPAMQPIGPLTAFVILGSVLRIRDPMTSSTIALRPMLLAFEWSNLVRFTWRDTGECERLLAPTDEAV